MTFFFVHYLELKINLIVEKCYWQNELFMQPHKMSKYTLTKVHQYNI